MTSVIPAAAPVKCETMPIETLLKTGEIGDRRPRPLWRRNTSISYIFYLSLLPSFIVLT